ncbi:hypothetical protein DL546_003487 [Coniochaeta pulveracea]|uniref:Uncharacterized protein n=1 Tax=Coniochaeta pulveracea TaxID=177199 RepID=A0A420YGC7_9PEZI|nr:hypothetical protein DL546_003487 [Coniochaeta pulveracea]
MDLVIRSADAVQVVHGSNSKCTKRGLGTFEIFDWDGGFSLETIMDSDIHRERRRIWDRAQNPQAMAHYEICTRKAVRTWLAKVASVEGEAIEMSKAMLLVAFDNMGQIGFSKEFGATQKGEGTRWIHLMGALLEQIAILGGLTWPTLVARSLEGLGKFGPLKDALEFNDISKDFAHERLDVSTSSLSLRLAENVTNRTQRDDPALHDIMKYFIDDYKSENPKSFVRDTDLYTDTQTILIAATDTSAATLTWLFYYLTIHPEIKSQLVSEISTARSQTAESGEFLDADLAHLPYLNAVINETLRIKPVGGNNSPRLTPPEGIVVDGTWIPGQVQVVIPIWALCRYEKYFERPLDFVPERWTTKPEMVKDKRAFIPFNHGRWSCAGKKLAMMLMRLVVAYTVTDFDFGFAEAEDGAAIVRDTKDVTLVKPGELRLRFTRRSA